MYYYPAKVNDSLVILNYEIRINVVYLFINLIHKEDRNAHNVSVSTGAPLLNNMTLSLTRKY